MSQLDDATGTFLRRLVADYAGVPYGAELKVLRRASESLNLNLTPRSA
jgi:hypothetical protein